MGHSGRIFEDEAVKWTETNVWINSSYSETPTKIKMRPVSETSEHFFFDREEARHFGIRTLTEYLLRLHKKLVKAEEALRNLQKGA